MRVGAWWAPPAVGPYDETKNVDVGVGKHAALHGACIASMRVAILDARNSSKLVQQLWEVRSPPRARSQSCPNRAKLFFSPRAAAPR